MSLIDDAPATLVENPASSLTPQALTFRQRGWRLLHGGEPPWSNLSSYAIRQQLQRQLADAGWPHMEMAVRTSLQSVLVTPLTLEANDWMMIHEGKVIQAMADIGRKVLPLKPEFLDIGFRPQRPTLYVIPDLVVVKKPKGGNSEPWMEKDLDEAHRDALYALIVQGIETALRAWNIHPPARLLKSVHIIDEGRPMPIVKPEGGPRPLARLGVRFLAPFALEGNLFIGGFPMLGFGKVIRGGEV